MRDSKIKQTVVVRLIVSVLAGWAALFMFAFSCFAEVSPISIASLKSQALAAFQAGRFDEAGQLFAQQAQSHEGAEHKAWFNAGASYWNAGRKKEAFQMYEQAVAVSPLYFKGHKRLEIRYESADETQVAENHRNHALAIGEVEKRTKPLRENAYAIRTRGGDWHQATALMHEKSARAYEILGYPEFAQAERQLAERSRAELAAETARLQNIRQQPQLDAQDRADNAKILNALAGLTAKGGSLNPGSSSAPSMGNSSAGSTAQGLGILQQGYSGYSQIAGVFDHQLQQQREVIHQQGQQTQAALADPKQAQLQGNAKQRTLALQQRLEDLEQEAAAYLVDKGLLDEKDEGAMQQDSLDLS